MWNDARVDAQAILESLLETIGASRVTLRGRTEDGREAGFPVAFEALAPGVPSIAGIDTPSMGRQPVVLRILAGEQVVQHDCDREFPDDAPFHAMLALYGGMRAQVVTPVHRDGELVAILSVHQLGAPREWSAEETAACRGAALRLSEALAPS